MDKPLLTDEQERILRALFANEWIRAHMYLTGGTALSAFHYRHRDSDDLDLFTHGINIDPAIPAARDAARDLGLPVTAEAGTPSFRRLRIGDVRVDLVRDVDFRVGAPLLLGGIMVDNVKNIAVNKVCAILGRIEPKDYVDLHFLLERERYDILELLALAQHKDAGVNPFLWSEIIQAAENLPALPRMTVPFEMETVRATFRALRDRILDSLRPT
ncbi:MAG: nucleotidyl transferase AbiEii/AbiGii toxin family protein [Planctomycetes bacterium]|nr:nucleotidyl transferase AbiEii/AbiGii toxin family protein [Planctomycetota bacterium]